ncbi:YbaB/EbfC family nucleoid-associated protein [Amycolatopsis pretoriensis]|nr:YbaB/EbfC family nucleoid-associated protein [Amycolatopsis pretoriensis]
MRQQATALDDELGRARFTRQSRDGAVTAVVSGRGQLVDLKISDQAMRGAHPQVVGPDVVEAVTAARRQAAAIALTKARAVFDKDQDWQPEPLPGSPGFVSPPATTTSTREDVEEEDFAELDFLTDDGYEDDDRGSR